MIEKYLSYNTTITSQNDQIRPHCLEMALTDCTMLAVAWKGPPYNKSVKTRPMPTIVNETDPIVRLSSTAVCGTDLHVYHSLCGSSEPGRIMGHEGVGYVDSIGSAIKCLDVGDYVVIPDNFGSSHYPERFPSTRLTQGYGQEYTKGGDVGGCQGERV